TSCQHSPKVILRHTKVSQTHAPKVFLYTQPPASRPETLYPSPPLRARRTPAAVAPRLAHPSAPASSAWQAPRFQIPLSNQFQESLPANAHESEFLRTARAPSKSAPRR